MLALNHKEPDRVPVDLGGTGLTQINREVYGAVLRRLGWPEDTSVQNTTAIHKTLVTPGDEFLDTWARTSVRSACRYPASPSKETGL